MSIWKGSYDLDALNAGGAKTLIELLDIRFTEIGDDFLKATMPVNERTRQPYGLLHGGASVVLAESLGSLAANMCVDRTKFICVGQEINANHVKSARRGLVTGVTRAAHLGGRTQVWTIEVVNEERQLICISRLTMAVVRLGALGP